LSAAQNRAHFTPRLMDLGLSGDRPLVIVDVDEVLGQFVRSFERYLAIHGVEFRVERYALFQNMFRKGEAKPIPEAEGRPLYDDFFRTCCESIEPTPGAFEALERLAQRAEIIVLSNAPGEVEAARRAWLTRHGVQHPLIINRGLKGPITAGLTAQTPHRSAFIDDTLPHLDSVAEQAPATARFQHIADVRLRPLAPTSDRHRRIDDWDELAAAIEESLLA